MKRIWIVLLLVVILGAALPTFAQSDPVASVNTGSLNVRTGPGMQYGSIAALPFGFGVQMIARNSAGNWVRIALTNGVTGWVNINYLYTNYNINNLPLSDAPVAPTVTPTATVTGVLALNLRTGASTDNAIIITVPLGTPVVLLGRSYNSMWAEVQLPDGTVGWGEASAFTASVPIRSLVLADGSVFVPFAPGFPGENTSGSSAGNGQMYVVRPGDTLSKIAQQYGVTMYALAAANHIYNYNLIYIGQQLIIPA